MPPPTTRCSICNQDVLKAQTYSIGDGKRACKSHPGVMDKKADLEKEQKDLKKVNELLKADNERLEKALADRKTEYAKVVAKLKAVVEEIEALDDGGKPAK